MTDDSGLRVLFLDTEGLSAPGNTADYDAKVFAVSTLLSSHLIYNSVKMIDEQSLEYLGVLSRRAQLFSLKALLHRDDLSGLDRLVGFPPLTWVVEDFFQLQLDDETPTQWLQRIMQMQETTRGAEKGPSLLSIFPEAHCHTLFLPATDRESLQNLDALDAADLHPDYKRDLAGLVSHLVASLRKSASAAHESRHCDEAPSNNAGGSSEHLPATLSTCRKGRDAKTGPELSALLRVLTSAANSGSMNKMPELWDLFIRDQVRMCALYVCAFVRICSHVCVFARVCFMLHVEEMLRVLKCAWLTFSPLNRRMRRGRNRSGCGQRKLRMPVRWSRPSPRGISMP
jgi:hypothetical protein